MSLHNVSNKFYIEIMAIFGRAPVFQNRTSQEICRSNCSCNSTYTLLLSYLFTSGNMGILVYKVKYIFNSRIIENELIHDWKTSRNIINSVTRLILVKLNRLSQIFSLSGWFSFLFFLVIVDVPAIRPNDSSIYRL